MIFKNKKGMTLVTVMLIMTVLVILCAILAETVMQTIVLTKRHRNIDLAYYAGESAIENWTSVIEQKICNNLDIGSDFGAVDLSSPTSRENYAKHIVSKVNLSDLKPQQIDIEGKVSSVSAVPLSSSATVVTRQVPDLVGVEVDSTSGNAIIISLGIKAEASYSSASAYNTVNKVVYAVKPFKVYCPKANELEGPIYTVGDFYINDSVVKVKGDVFTFGTYASEIKSPAQYNFGGIYAKNNSKLTVYGNAYSRSFIRAGQYLEKDALGNDFQDNTDIFIYKDAIAQCIQSFGNKDRIAILRNAYTFDDLEINGSNSVVAVNGSFFGLANGFGRYHDDSSAIVNSAVIHQQLISDSFKSRIAINGDVLIGGSTVKIDPETGDSVGEIEDASLAFNAEDGVPYYKYWSDWDKLATTPPQATISEYHDDLRNFYKLDAVDGKMDKFRGDFNLFQIFDIFNPLAVGFDESVVENWLSDIMDPDILKTKTVPQNIQGISVTEMVANNKLYVFPEGGPDTDETKYNNLFVNRTTNPLGLYKLDNLFDGNKPKYYGNEKDWWNMKNPLFKREDDTPFDDSHYDFYQFLYGTLEPRGGHCGEIYKELLAKTNRFAYRDYPTGSALNWYTKDVTEFDNILEKVSGLSGSSYVLNVTAAAGEHDIVDLFKPGIPDLYQKCKDSRDLGFDDDKEYFLVANANKNVDIVISGTFNGIIVTAGKIILKDGASVYGAIIAAGDGDTVSGKFIPRAKEIPKTDDPNYTSAYNGLNNGDYAAISVKGASDVYIDFFLGMAGDSTTALDEVGINSVIEKARETDRGKLVIDDTVVANPDKKMLYLNKAARINLLQKFLNKGSDSIDLYDIF